MEQSSPVVPLFSFGVASDIQYADKESEGGKKFYREAKEKFAQCVETWNTLPLLFTIHLGDIIDGNSTLQKSQEDLEDIMKEFQKNTHLHHHVIGNHCLKVPRDILYHRLKVTTSYYDFVVKERWRFIILDGTEISTYGWPSTSPNHLQAEKWLSEHSIDKCPNASDWNSAIGEGQKTWLKERLREAKKKKERVIICCHYPVLPQSAAPSHLLWNGQEIVDILEDKEVEGVVVAYLSGHFHEGGYALHNKIHYWTVHGILEAPNGNNCYGVVDVYEDRLEVKGFGTIPNKTLWISS